MKLQVSRKNMWLFCFISDVNLGLPCSSWIRGNISCTDTCIIINSCTAIFIPSITGLLSHMLMGLFTTILQRDLSSTQLVEPCHFSSLGCHHGPPFSSFPLQLSKQWMITAAFGYPVTPSTDSSEIILHIMMCTTSFMAANTTSRSHFLLCGTNSLGLTCLIHQSIEKVVDLRQDLRRSARMTDNRPLYVIHVPLFASSLIYFALPS